MVRWPTSARRRPISASSSSLRRVGLAAALAQHAHQPLRDRRDQRRRDQERLDAHVDQPRDRARPIVGVERREHQVAGEAGLDRDLGGLEVADLADQDHVRVLAQDRAQARGEGEPDRRLHLDLADARQLDLDRVLDRDDVVLGLVDVRERGVERGRLARAGRPGDQDDPVVAPDQLAQRLLVARRSRSSRSRAAPACAAGAGARSARRTVSAASRAARRSRGRRSSARCGRPGAGASRRCRAGP